MNLSHAAAIRPEKPFSSSSTFAKSLTFEAFCASVRTHSKADAAAGGWDERLELANIYGALLLVSEWLPYRAKLYWLLFVKPKPSHRSHSPISSD
jgi:hypothetical protein